MRIRAALLVDNLRLAVWQKHALDNVSDLLDVQLVLNCQNTTSERNLRKHFAYYCLNFLSLKNEMTKKVALKLPNSQTIGFDSLYHGMWQSIPPEVSKAVNGLGIKLIIKFGMSLLRIDEDLARLDILSFHHGDPEYYRGRPAGFYELYQNSDRVGIIVQKLSNKLDAGEILARAYAKAYHHSYKRTAMNFYSLSRHVLRKAVLNYGGERVPIQRLGTNYRLPSNMAVLNFTMKLICRKISRIVYGAVYEKKWNIAKLPFPGLNELTTIAVANGSIPLLARGYAFYADPFFSANGNRIRVEALNSKTGLGELVEFDEGLTKISVFLKGAHFSYPYSFADSATEYVIPEVASHSAPYVLRVEEGEATKLMLRGLEDQRFVDGSLIQHQGIYYFFAGHANSSADCLYLYSSTNLTGPYVAHPQNPIVIDPSSARMAGRLYRCGNRICRFGQNSCFRYGNGITVSEISELSQQTYSERPIGKISFKDASGPHTLDIHEGSMVLDFYIEKLSILAGYRRLAARTANTIRAFPG